MNLSYRAIEKSDEPFLWEMLYQALYVPEGAIPFPREIIQQPELRQYAEYWGNANDIGVIALNDEIPVGAVWLRLMKGYGFVDAQTPELTIAILPAFRGCGIGSKLMDKLLQLSLPFKAISLSVSHENPAKRLYQRLGFRGVKDDKDSVTMVMYL